jgi:hypothetical protein
LAVLSVVVDICPYSAAVNFSAGIHSPPARRSEPIPALSAE